MALIKGYIYKQWLSREDRSDKWMGKLLSGLNLGAHSKDVRPVFGLHIFAMSSQEQQHPEHSKEKHKVSSIISERNHFGGHLNQLNQRDTWDSSTETTSEYRHPHRHVCLCSKIA